MRLKLKSIGNQVGIVFPKSILKKHQLHIGDDIFAKDNEEYILLQFTDETSKKYNLADLVSQTKNYKLTNEDKKWLGMRDIGLEDIWK